MTTLLSDLLPAALLEEMLAGGYVRHQFHPTAPLAILNYTERAAYDGVWNDVTRQCRGLVYVQGTLEVVARPFPKFFNYGEPSAPGLDLDAPAEVTDKLDGSLGILYPVGDGYAVATRGSFASEQALHATDVWRKRYAARCGPRRRRSDWTGRRSRRATSARVDYGDFDDLILLAVLDTATGEPVEEGTFIDWSGPTVDTHPYATLAAALAADPRPGAEGLVVYLPDLNERVKIKQDDYVALHRILTGTNARHVWEYAAVRACRDVVREPKHWASYLGVDPARAAQLLEVGDGWLEQAGVPDEFYEWVRATIDEAEESAGQQVMEGLRIAEEAARIADRSARYAFVEKRAGPLVRETMRIASGGGQDDLDLLRLRAWRESCPAPTAPFARTEDVA